MRMPIGFPLALVALVALIGYIMPRLTRPDLFFAVTVSPEFTATFDGRKLLRRYRTQILIHSLAGLAMVLVGHRADLVWLVVVGLAWQIAGNTYAIVDAHRRTLPYGMATAGHVREAEIAPRQTPLPGAIAWMTGPFLLLAAAAFSLHQHWDRIPALVPVHWGLAGAPDRWAVRSPGSVYGPILAIGFACVILFLSCLGVLYGTRRIAVAGAAAERETRFRRLIAAFLIAIGYLIVLPSFWFALQPLKAVEGASLPFRILPVISIVCAVAVLIRAGQGGSRLRVAAAGEEPVDVIGDRTPDQCWKWGLIYVNPDDPAVLVEKRFGVGYTLNFGNRWTWAMVGALAAIAAAMIVWLP